MAKILVIDDSGTIRQLVRLTLADIGHDVTEADNGAAGLELIKKHKFDLVISDLNMPQLNGIDMVKKVREDSASKGLPILMLTTEYSEDQKNAGRNAGVTGWLTKPFDQKKLLNVVEKVLG